MTLRLPGQAADSIWIDSEVGAAPPPEAVKQAEDALNALRGARDAEGRERAADALEKALKKLRGQGKLGGGADAGPRRR